MDNGKKRPAINPPGETSPSDPGYLRQCGFALEPSIHRLIEMAVDAGWERENVVAAILVETGRLFEGGSIAFGAPDDACSEEQLPEPISVGPGRLH
ncbi:hypothetical protein ATER59S_00981 [Aquamicrobium terrae]